jgi:hypothetical protein
MSTDRGSCIAVAISHAITRTSAHDISDIDFSKLGNTCVRQQELLVGFVVDCVHVWQAAP